MYKVT